MQLAFGGAEKNIFEECLLALCRILRVFEKLEGLVLSTLAGGDISVRADRSGDTAFGIAHRHDTGLADAFFAVLADKAHFACPAAIAGHGFQHRRCQARLVFGPVQHRRGLPQRFFFCVAVQRRECGVAVGDPPRYVRDDKGIVHILKRQRLLTQDCFCPPAL